MAKTPEFKYAPMFQLGKDNTEYRLLTKEGVSTAEFEGKTILKVTKKALTLLAQQAFHDVEFMLRREAARAKNNWSEEPDVTFYAVFVPEGTVLPDGESTGISSVVNNGVKVAPVRYNLSGQRVEGQYKGIVIVNGRKQLLK